MIHTPSTLKKFAGAAVASTALLFGGASAAQAATGDLVLCSSANPSSTPAHTCPSGDVYTDSVQLLPSGSIDVTAGAASFTATGFEGEATWDSANNTGTVEWLEEYGVAGLFSGFGATYDFWVKNGPFQFTVDPNALTLDLDGLQFEVDGRLNLPGNPRVCGTTNATYEVDGQTLLHGTLGSKWLTGTLNLDLVAPAGCPDPASADVELHLADDTGAPLYLQLEA